jgi:hypothetical protein
LAGDSRDPAAHDGLVAWVCGRRFENRMNRAI